MAYKPLLGKGKSSTMSTVIILRHGIIPSKAAVGAAVIVDAAVHRGRKLTARVCNISSVFWAPMRPKKQTCNCIQESWTSPLWSTTWVQWGLEVITLWPPWAGANSQLKLRQLGTGYPSTWGNQQQLVGRIPGVTAILPLLEMSQCLCTFLDQGQRETCSLTGYKSDGGSRQDRCGKAAVCIPSMQP